MKWMRWWWPALVWAALVTSFSTDSFSAEHTSRLILPLLRWLFPHAAPETLDFAHLVIRKAAHVSEYFIFSLLVLRAFRAGRGGWRWTWAYSTMLVVGCFALLDEFHQLFVPGRGASVLDSLLDTCAGAAALLVFWIIERRRIESGRTGQHGA